MEVYSPPRVAIEGAKLGLEAGPSIDLTYLEEDGNPCDFNDPRMRNKTIRRVIEEKPFVVITSPMFRF